MSTWTAASLDRFCAHTTAAAAALDTPAGEYSGSVELELVLDSGAVLPYRMVVRGGRLQRCERRGTPAPWALRGPVPPFTGAGTGNDRPAPAAWTLRAGSRLRTFPPGDEADAPHPEPVRGADLDVVWRLDSSPIGDVVALHRFRDGVLEEATLHAPHERVPASPLRIEGRSDWWRRVAWRAGGLHLLEAIDPVSLEGRWEALDLALALHLRMYGAAARTWPAIPTGMWWLAGPGRRLAGTVAGDALARLTAEEAG